MMSPIPPDPGYIIPRQTMINKWCGEDHRPKPRVRPEAEEIAKTHQGSVGLLLELQGKPVYRHPPKQKPQPKDFGSANVRKMRQVQALNRRRQREEEADKTKPVRVLPQSEKYQDVTSKLSEHLKKEPPQPRPASANFLRSHSRTGGIPRQRGRSPSPTPQAPRGRSPSPAPRSQSAVEKEPPQPRPASANFLHSHSRTRGIPRQRGRSPSPAPQAPRVRSLSPAPRSQSAVELRGCPRDRSTPISFIAHNANQAKKYHPPRVPTAMAQQALNAKIMQDKQNYKHGEVPKYLQNRQKQWRKEEDEQIKNTPDPDMPPGHRKMPDDERRKTLEILRGKEKELIKELHQLPLNAETMRAKTRKRDVETRIAEVEEAIKIFSRSKVFVKIDS